MSQANHRHHNFSKKKKIIKYFLITQAMSEKRVIHKLSVYECGTPDST